MNKRRKRAIWSVAGQLGQQEKEEGERSGIFLSWPSPPRHWQCHSPNTVSSILTHTMFISAPDAASQIENIPNSRPIRLRLWCQYWLELTIVGEVLSRLLSWPVTCRHLADISYSRCYDAAVFLVVTPDNYINWRLLIVIRTVKPDIYQAHKEK